MLATIGLHVTTHLHLSYLLCHTGKPGVVVGGTAPSHLPGSQRLHSKSFSVTCNPGDLGTSQSFQRLHIKKESIEEKEDIYIVVKNQTTITQ